MRVGSIAGIGVYLHWSLLLMLGWIAFIGFQSDTSQGLYQLLFISLVFVIILLHELGHCLMARRFGIGTHDITLLPVGGLARLERMPDDPKQELLVAVAGPAVNVVLAIFFYVLLRAQGQIFEIVERGQEYTELASVLSDGTVLGRLVTVNVMLVLFNMLPAFPMDGGRVLRAALASRMDHARATRIAATVGQIMAVIFFWWGLNGGNPFLFVIAFVVFFGAEGEARFSETKMLLSGFRVRNAMITHFQTLSENDPLSVAVEHILAGFQQDFPVTRMGNVVGVVTGNSILKALGQQGNEALVSEVMERNIITTTPDESLESAFSRIQQCACSTVPVLEDNELVGILTMENVGEFILVQNALRLKAR